MQSTNTGSETRSGSGSDLSQAAADRLAAGKAKLSEMAESATEVGRAGVDASLGHAAGDVDRVRDALGRAADQLKNDQMAGIAGYTERLADSLGNLATRLRTTSVEDLAADARQLARTQPALFLAGSVAIGFALTRIVKASSARVSGSTTDWHGTSSQSTSPAARAAAADEAMARETGSSQQAVSDDPASTSGIPSDPQASPYLRGTSETGRSGSTSSIGGSSSQSDAERNSSSGSSASPYTTGGIGGPGSSIDRPGV